MKRIFTMLLAVVLVCSLGVTGYAAKTEDPLTDNFYEAVQYNERYADAAFTASVPVHRLYGDYDRPFEEIYENAKQNSRAVGIYRDGVLTTEELRFYKNEDGGFDLGQHREQSDLGALIEQYGSELLVLEETESMRFVIFPNDPQTMYRMEELLKADPVPYRYTFAEYQKAVGYRVNYKGDGVFGDADSQNLHLPMGDALMERANSYWEYIEHQAEYERRFGLVFFGVIAAAIGLITLAVWLSRRRKAKEREQG